MCLSCKKDPGYYSYRFKEQVSSFPDREEEDEREEEEEEEEEEKEKNEFWTCHSHHTLLLSERKHHDQRLMAWHGSIKPAPAQKKKM